jgi:hypothetical protein
MGRDLLVLLVSWVLSVAASYRGCRRECGHRRLTPQIEDSLPDLASRSFGRRGEVGTSSTSTTTERDTPIRSH